MLEGDGVGIFEKVIFLQVLWMLIIEVWGKLLNLWRKQNSKKKAETLIFIGKKIKEKEILHVSKSWLESKNKVKG